MLPHADFSCDRSCPAQVFNGSISTSWPVRGVTRYCCITVHRHSSLVLQSRRPRKTSRSTGHFLQWVMPQGAPLKCEHRLDHGTHADPLRTKGLGLSISMPIPQPFRRPLLWDQSCHVLSSVCAFSGSRATDQTDWKGMEFYDPMWNNSEIWETLRSLPLFGLHSLFFECLWGLTIGHS